MPGCPCKLPGAGDKVAPEGMKGIADNRRCTDLLCLLVFVLFMLVGIILGAFAIQNGNPASLVYGRDDNGNICGSDNKAEEVTCKKDGGCFWSDRETKTDGGKWAHELEKGSKQAMNIDYSETKFANYPRLVEDMYDFYTSGNTDPLSIQFFGVCVAECPSTPGWTCSPYGEALLSDGDPEAEHQSLRTQQSKFLKSISPEHCPDCIKELNDCKNNKVVNPEMPASLQEFSNAWCGKLLKACFLPTLPTKDMMYRCLPQYNQTVTYACDDDGDGQPDPDPNDKSPSAAPIIRTKPFSAEESGKCGTMIKTTVSQESAQPNVMYEQLGTALAIIGRMIQDLSITLHIIVIAGVALAVVFGFMWLFLLKFCARVFVWITIVFALTLELTLTIFFLHKAGMITVEQESGPDESGVVAPTDGAANDEANNTLYRWAGIAMIILLVVQFVTLIAAIKKINVAAQIISEASKAVGAMFSMVAYPLFPVTLICCIFVWFIFTAACLFSMGEISGQDLVDAANEASGSGGRNESYFNTTANLTMYRQVHAGMNLTASADVAGADVGRWLLLLHLFIALWGNAFVQGTTIMTIAGAVSGWYFTETESGHKNQKWKFPVCASLLRVIRYHLGSVAFGSCIVALVQVARAIMLYIDQQTKHLQEKSCIIKVLMKCVHCILWCFEKCVKYLTANAYIYVAVKGHSFCIAAFHVFGTIKSNLGQMAIVGSISSYLMLIGKVVITCFSCFVTYMWIENGYADGTGPSSPVLPVAFTAVLAYFVACTFMQVYEISIDTILICFCEDKKNNDGEQNLYFMSDKMRRMAGLSGKCMERDDDGDGDGDVEMVKMSDSGDSDDDDSSSGDKPAPHFSTGGNELI